MGPIPDPWRANYKILTGFLVAPQNLVDKFSCRGYGSAAQVRKTRTGPDATNPAALRCSRVLFFGIAAIAVGGMSGCRGGICQSPNAKKAPGASTRTSQHGSEEPPDTFSAGVPRRASHMVPARRPGPRARPCGLPRRSAFPKVRFPAAGSPEGSPAPDLDGRSRLAVPPSIRSRGPGSPAQAPIARRLSPLPRPASLRSPIA